MVYKGTMLTEELPLKNRHRFYFTVTQQFKPTRIYSLADIPTNIPYTLGQLTVLSYAV